MPQYISPLGISCTVDEAKPGGTLRPGYKELVGPGDYIHFDIMMRDQAPATRSAFLTDGIGKQLSAARYGLVSDADLTQASAAADVAYERSKTAPNDWRKDTAKSAETVRSIRDARWL